jgi:ribosome-binding protein aMBF1 (putative translation factor)
MGFAYRHIPVKFTLKARKPSQPKPLPASVKTMADWIQLKLRERGMSPYHLALKMGIATSVVNVWKDGLARPQNRQMREMVTIFGHVSVRSFRRDRRWPLLTEQAKEML